MEIKLLYRKYTQKSRVFLYPLLNIKRGGSVLPIETYLCWEGRFTTADNKLICVFHNREDSDFTIFKDVKLLGNERFHSYFELEPDEDGIPKVAFVFDFEDVKLNFQRVVYGGYSQLSESHKKAVIRYYTGHQNFIYIRSYLYPEGYYENYSRLLVHDKSDAPGLAKLIREVGEVCDTPTMKREILTSKADVMNFAGISLDLL